MTKRFLARRSVLAGLVAFSILAVSSAAWAQGGKAILDTNDTIWRCHDTWQTDLARTDDGKLVHVDPYNPREKGPGGYKLLPTTKVMGSDFPPDDWRKVEFDDTGWRRVGGQPRFVYRSMALLCARGKFTVTDPAKAGPLDLNLTYHGGIVVYMNGKEVGRANLPKDKLANDTLADDYAKEAFTKGNGLINHLKVFGVQNQEGYTWQDYKAPELAARLRTLKVTIPATALQKGTNVLALEIHRSPAIAEMFSYKNQQMENDAATRLSLWWNRCELMEATLAAPAGATGIVPNNTRPAGFQVYNHYAFETVDHRRFGDSTEPLKPIRLAGARNGIYAGELVASSTDAIHGLKATVSDLKGPGTIPPAAVQVRYALAPAQDHWSPFNRFIEFDTLTAAAPDPVNPLKTRLPKNAAMQPIWISVSVPRDAAPGHYTAQVSVSAQGQQPVHVPLELDVCGWTLPDSKDFTFHMGLVQSPDSLALQYNVEMWSEQHWKLLEQSFALMGQLGGKEITIPVVRQSHYGNQHSMVRWVKQPDGKHKLDFSIVEKYLDLAIKYQGKIPVVNCEIAEPTPAHQQGLLYTEVDGSELKEAVGPKWGTAESKEFLKPLVAGLHDVLAKRGLENAMMFGVAASSEAAGPTATPPVYADIRAVAPNVKWVRVSHYWFGDSEVRADRPKYGRVALVGGVLGMFWDPQTDKPIYGWKNPELFLVYPRTTTMGDYAGVRLGQESDLPEHRFFAEAVLISGRRKTVNLTRGNIAGEVGYDKFLGVRGVGPFGFDFWPVLKGAQSSKTILGRYGDGYGEGGWGTISMNWVVQSLIAAGKDGPASTQRSETMRESLQESEARMFVQNALLDPAKKAKLPADLAKRADELCTERNQAFRFISEFWDFQMVYPSQWQARSAKLYELAGEIAKALGGASPGA